MLTRPGTCLQVVRFIPGLQRQMVVIIASVGQMGNFCLILLLYMFIYAVRPATLPPLFAFICIYI